MTRAEGKASGHREGATSTSIAPASARFTRRRDSAVLLVIDGPDAGLRASVGPAGAVVGGAVDCDLPLTDPTVSRHHLRARWTGTALEIEDLGSKNGSFFAGNRIAKLEVALGASLAVGHTQLKVLPDDEVLAPVATDGDAFGPLIGRSPAIRQLFALIDQIAAADVSVLLEGETGVGKELVAEELHRRSARRDRPFVVLDCGAVPTELIESTLYGHRRGAFTGASDDRAGVFAEADTGTVFLDEIGELRPDHQPALLRALDRGQVRPVGATGYRQVNVRVIAASHRDFGALIDSGAFREDLYYRLAVVRLRVPPLRDRREDVPLLVRHFLRRLGRPDLHVDDRALARVADYPWPGNVRELRNAVDRAVALATGDTIELDPAPPHRARPARHDNPYAGAAELPSFRAAKAEAVEAFEHHYLTELLARAGSIKAAARAAAMDRKHLRTLLRRYGITPGEDDGGEHQ